MQKITKGKQSVTVWENERGREKDRRSEMKTVKSWDEEREREKKNHEEWGKMRKREEERVISIKSNYKHLLYFWDEHLPEDLCFMAISHFCQTARVRLATQKYTFDRELITLKF